MVNVLVLMAWLVTMVAGQNDKLRLSPAAGPTFKQWLHVGHSQFHNQSVRSMQYKSISKTKRKDGH